MDRFWKTLALLCFVTCWIANANASLSNRNHGKYFNVPYEIVGENNRTMDPPPHELVAKMARYIVHKSGNTNLVLLSFWASKTYQVRYLIINLDWTALSTISTHDPIVGYPFANIFSVSDGPIHISKGIPYFYLTDMEISVQDLKV